MDRIERLERDIHQFLRNALPAQRGNPFTRPAQYTGATDAGEDEEPNVARVGSFNGKSKFSFRFATSIMLHFNPVAIPEGHPNPPIAPQVQPAPVAPQPVPPEQIAAVHALMNVQQPLQQAAQPIPQPAPILQDPYTCRCELPFATAEMCFEHITLNLCPMNTYLQPSVLGMSSLITCRLVLTIQGSLDYLNRNDQQTILALFVQVGDNICRWRCTRCNLEIDARESDILQMYFHSEHSCSSRFFLGNAPQNLIALPDLNTFIDDDPVLQSLITFLKTRCSLCLLKLSEKVGRLNRSKCFNLRFCAPCRRFIESVSRWMPWFNWYRGDIGPSETRNYIFTPYASLIAWLIDSGQYEYQMLKLTNQEAQNAHNEQHDNLNEDAQEDFPEFTRKHRYRDMIDLNPVKTWIDEAYTQTSDLLDEIYNPLKLSIQTLLRDVRNLNIGVDPPQPASNFIPRYGAQLGCPVRRVFFVTTRSSKVDFTYRAADNNKLTKLVILMKDAR